jgi:galactokinase/mevalonate kinase-like predicted kinase
MSLNQLLLAIIIMTVSNNATAQTILKEQKKAEKTFITHADEALHIMKQEALRMNIKGAGVVCFIPGNETQSWVSKMIIVGATGNEGYNFIAIANSKASEMAETLKNSGSKVRPVKVGEFDYLGGTIKKIDSGYLLSTFSGASGEDDLAVANKGIDWFITKFK